MNARTTVSIEGLYRYPIKSCHRSDLAEATITRTGFEWDRAWVVAEPNGDFVSQRKPWARPLALVTADVGNADLVVRAPGRPALHIPLEAKPEDSPRRTVKIHQDLCRAIDEGDGAATWFSDYLGHEVRLLRMDPAFERPVDEFYTGHGDGRAAGQDGFPYLVTSVESLEEVNRIRQERGLDSIPMSRFRPNIVISGLDPFAEDRLSVLTRGEDVEVRIVKPCGRCPIITVDQDTSLSDLKAPEGSTLEHLGTHRTAYNAKGERKTMFGQNALIEHGIGRTLNAGDILNVSFGVSNVYSDRPDTNSR